MEVPDEKAFLEKLCRKLLTSSRFFPLLFLSLVLSGAEMEVGVGEMGFIVP